MKIRKKQSGILSKALNLCIVLLTCIITIEIMFVADYTFDLSNNGKRAIVFLKYIQQQEYEKCLNYYYANEALGVKPDEDLQECYAVAQYYEAAYQYRVYVEQGKNTQADEARKRMEDAASRMGELAPVRDRIDRILR